MLKSKSAPIAPWKRIAKAIRRRELSVLDGLSELVGEEVASARVAVWRRARLRDVKSETRHVSAKTGVVYAPPRTAKVALAKHFLRHEDSKPVRDMALLFCALMHGLRPDRHRTCSKALVVGDPRGRLAYGLGAELFTSQGRAKSNREIQRYLSVFRDHDAGPVAWQPPKAIAEQRGIPISKRGHSYNVYEWGRLPGRLVAVIADWWKALEAHKRRAQKVLTVSSPTPAPPVDRKPSKDGSAFAAALLSRFDPLP